MSERNKRLNVSCLIGLMDTTHAGTAAKIENKLEVGEALVFPV
jgi:hypothetical protein